MRTSKGHIKRAAPVRALCGLIIRGVTETLFSRERWREPRFAPVPLTLAHLLLFHRRLDGCSHTTRAYAQIPCIELRYRLY